MKVQIMVKDFISPAVPFFNRFAPLTGPPVTAQSESSSSKRGLGRGWADPPILALGTGGNADFGRGVASRRRVLASKKKRRLCARTSKSIAKNGWVQQSSDSFGSCGEPINIPDSQVPEMVSESIKKEKEYGAPDCGCIFRHCGCPKPPADPCRARGFLMGKARGVLRHLRKFHGLRSRREIPLDELSCLTFRKVIRSQLPEDLTLVQELTIKTSSKIVKNACPECQEILDKKVSEYKKGLFTPVEVCDKDLERFKLAFRMNVPDGWNSTECPYIPNGHATRTFSRKEGGNWNEEEFSTSCGVAAILSSGKPRIVTTYSGYNSEVLHSLHQSLYGSIRRKGWLLVGPPTDEKVKNLNGLGPLMSYDYEAATDRIKAAYVGAAVEILKEKAKLLSPAQVACLDVVKELRFHGSRHAAPRGQPMGSLMSFPLLCLINKTTVDLALADLLQAKKISFKEWTSHRCLINGDDLLIRSPTVSHELYDASHRKWAEAAGMKVNAEKTMIAMDEGEINSTLFQNGELKKKTNLSALYMSGNTDDVVGVAYSAASSVAEFRRMVSLNAHLLARQSEKFPSPVPLGYRKELLTLPRVRRALRALPTSKRPAEEGTLPMSEKPEGYDLDGAEECMVVSEAVKRARALGLFKAKLEVTTQVECQEVTENAVPCMRWFLRRNRKPKRELILSCLARYWEEKKKKRLWVEECASLAPSSQIVSDDSRIGGMLDAIRAWKSARLPCRPLMPFPDDGEADGHVTEGLLLFV
jgi:hypothetical protein